MSSTEQALFGARRLVVKVGSSSVSGENADQIPLLVDQLARLSAAGVEVLLVSSGAISTGVPYLELETRPDDLATQQAAAAVGQNVLINRYQRALSAHNLIAGQVLLTAQDMQNPTHRGNAKRSLERLLQLRILPIVNENDTVATHEIRFGDNDRLAALVARLVDADTLVLLSDVDALYTAPPTEKGAKRIARVPYGDELSGVRIGEAESGWGTGGAQTKVQAARLAADAGVSVVLTETSRIGELLDGVDLGTWFEAAPAATAASA
ncbi:MULTISPECIES: glutamate 5-kinase [unclassified Leucobacter]|uniref:glutamate 5-kinase n=1 Tax=unclassified Leucobacter TaxID=2621730 RepID=UPI00165E928B|nr:MULTISPECIES: glutamate 5-kinase [unclassified Leucobacter]MBC9926789.1 glutamate 5-kinase [Leucobacter sp. cx-169]